MKVVLALTVIAALLSPGAAVAANFSPKPVAAKAGCFDRCMAKCIKPAICPNRCAQKCK